MIRARIEYEPMFDGCRLLMIDKGESGTFVRTWIEQQRHYEERGTATNRFAADNLPGQFLSFSDEELRAIYAAIGEYFGLQPQDASLLRQDYLAERARVDKFIDKAVQR